MRLRALAGAALLLVVLAPAARASEKVHFTAPRSGEAKLSFTASVPGTAWDRAGREAALLNVHVDGRWVADVVTFAGENRFRYETARPPRADRRAEAERRRRPRRAPRADPVRPRPPRDPRAL
jgi:hypothetical protein